MMTNRLTRTWLNMALALFAGLGVVDESTAGTGATTTPPGDGSTAAATAAGTGAAETTALGGTPAAAAAAATGTEVQKGKEGEAKAGAPETYEAFTMPEGVTLDAARAAEFSTIAKGLGLTQVQAQQLVDLEIKNSTAQAEAHANTVKGWAAELKADKDYGGDKLPATLADCKKVMDTFATPALREYLDGTGLGNHPELVRFVAKIGKGLSEDVFVKGGTTTSGSTTPAQAMYPTSNMNP